MKNHRWFSLIAAFIFCICCQKNKPIQIGEQLPEFIRMQWLQSPPITISKLKGKVVLIRWWTDECIFCMNSADALNNWYNQYHEKGLIVLGIYHVKPIDRKVSLDDIREFAIEKGFQFPIGVDQEWKNLNRYWLESGPKDYTSISILLDKNGKIRYIHPGGEYHKEEIEGHEHCVKDYMKIDSLIRQLLAK